MEDLTPQWLVTATDDDETRTFYTVTYAQACAVADELEDDGWHVEMTDLMYGAPTVADL